MTRGLVTLIQLLACRIIGTNRHYLSTANEVLSHTKVRNIYLFCHLAPSFIITILFVTRLLPLLSNSYSLAMEKNGGLISLTFIPAVVIILLANGIAIEKLLISYNDAYRQYAEDK